MFDESEFPDPAWGDLDWLSEEKYNVMKEKYNNMPKKKKKLRRKRKKLKLKRKRKDRLCMPTLIVDKLIHRPEIIEDTRAENGRWPGTRSAFFMK